MPRPVTDFDFELPEEGYHIAQVSEINFIDTEKGLLAKTKSEILDGEHPENIGQLLFDNFPLYVDVGVMRLLGLLTVTINIPDKDYPIEYFDDAKIQAKVAAQLTGKAFGCKVKHNKTKQGNTMANIKTYYNRDHMKSIISESKEKTDSKSSPPEGKKSGARAKKEEAPPAETTTECW